MTLQTKNRDIIFIAYEVDYLILRIPVLILQGIIHSVSVFHLLIINFIQQ